MRFESSGLHERRARGVSDTNCTNAWYQARRTLHRPCPLPHLSSMTERAHALFDVQVGRRARRFRRAFGETVAHLALEILLATCVPALPAPLIDVTKECTSDYTREMDGRCSFSHVLVNRSGGSLPRAGHSAPWSRMPLRPPATQGAKSPACHSNGISNEQSTPAGDVTG